jgi:tetratricopeptide (TPR) repeat protein
VLYRGVQNIYLGDAGGARHLDVALSIAAPQRDDRFPLRGRGALVTELAGLLAGGTAGAGPRVRVLHGMGGCGKTSIAVEVAAGAAAWGVETWWIPATEESRFTAGMTALARRVGVSEPELRGGDAADLLWQRLAVRAKPWLLVIDNADDLDVLRVGPARLRDGTGWVRPPGAAGLVVVTTRDGDPGVWGTWARLHRVGVLPAAEAALVLADHAGGAAGLGSAQDAGLLAERLGGLPLALRLAGSYLAEAVQVPAGFSAPDTLRSYAEYRQVLEDGGLDRAFPAGGLELGREQAREVIGRTWELSLELLERRGLGEARVLLRLLAVLADAPVPYALLLDPGTLAGSGLLPGIGGERVWQVLRALAGFGMIDLPGPEQDSGEVPVLRLHPLVRDASAAPAGSGLDECLALAAALLERAAEAEETGLPEDPPAWPAWQRLARHAFHVFDVIAARPAVPDSARADAAAAADLAARYQAARGLYAEADARQRAVLDVRLRVFGAEHLSTLAARSNIVWVMAMRGDHAGAAAEYRAILAARIRLLGAEHPDTLLTRYNIAGMMAERGDHAGAQAEYRAVLATQTRLLGADHPSTLNTRHNLACEMARQRDHAGAEAEYRTILAAQTRLLGAEHRNTLLTRYNIAGMMAKRGDHAEAEPEYRTILAAQSQLLGAEHPDTLNTRYNIAGMMAERGDHAGAQAEYRAVLAAQTPLLGADHPDTLNTRHNLACEMAQRGNLAEAEPEYRAVLAAQTRLLGAEHHDTQRTSNNLVWVMAQRGDHAEAE